MATDGPDPTPCSKEMLEKGQIVFVTHSIPSNAMEGWVKKVAEKSGQDVDWHFEGGRAVVMTLGDVSIVKKALEEFMPEHDELYRKHTNFSSGR